MYNKYLQAFSCNKSATCSQKTGLATQLKHFHIASLLSIQTQWLIGSIQPILHITGNKTKQTIRSGKVIKQTFQCTYFIRVSACEHDFFPKIKSTHHSSVC